VKVALVELFSESNDMDHISMHSIWLHDLQITQLYHCARLYVLAWVICSRIAFNRKLAMKRPIYFNRYTNQILVCVHFIMFTCI